MNAWHEFLCAHLWEQARPFIDEAWADLEDHARHLWSILAPGELPTADAVTNAIAGVLAVVSPVTATLPRVGERVEAARPYLDAVLTGRSTPPFVPIVDLLFTINLLMAVFAAAIPAIAASMSARVSASAA